ncbi:MAG: carboxypeptidase-like regulatory domain-containing protein [Bacteroides sp.]|uniref:carboxypeptidase-like regulatory domain-containing protein n=1 Tax=Bacteroides sp. TaxID=29523 RepID=UPI0026DEEDC8|nr:carboxypeptidase-like regulatory domain-containing protein [Bacteroides sp.]MDO5421841.1 carboxypeptidase-like regulatory domain-containing protein [Bacteroides sp.]
MRLLFIALLTTFFLHTELFAQSYQGVVTNINNKKPLTDVSVSLLSADSTIISYSYTDAQGHFDIKPNSPGHFLSFSCIGYKRLMFPVTQFKDGMNIQMEETTVQIREVKITSQRIRQKKDTLTYTVSGFKMPQDRTIEDVLKKIPGIEVTPNGTIKFQDKPISNFYIEGMNLLEEKYALGSKNIPADMVKEVQVLQGHQPIAALRGKSFSDNAALNLTLNSHAKRQLIKIIDLGIGVGNDADVLWDNRLLGMLFGKNMQNLTMYKNNNTGKDIAAEIISLTQTGIPDALNESGNDDFFSPSMTSNINIDPERYLFNESHLAAINHLYKPNNKTDLRLQFNALHNEETANHQSATTYFYPSQTVIIDETENYSGQENRAEGELTYLLNDSSVYIKNTLKGKIGLHKSRLNLIVNKQKTNEYVHPEQKFIQNSFELIKNRSNNALSIYSVNAYMELPQFMTVSPGPFEGLLNDGKAYGILKQAAHLETFQSNNYTYFQHKLAGFYLKYKAGIKYSQKRMTSAMYTDHIPIQEQNFTNDLQMKSCRLYVEPSLNYKNSFWNIQASIPFAFLYQHLKYKKPEADNLSAQHFMPMPELNIRYEMNAHWNGTILSSFSCIEPDIQQLYAGYLFSSYRSASAYTSQLNYNKSWHNLLGVRFNNPLTGFFFSASGFYNMGWQDIIYSYENTDNYLTLCKAHILRNNNYFWGARSRLSKAFAWSKLYLAFSGGYTQNRNKVLLEEKLINASLSSINLKFDFSLQPNRYINIDGNSAATQIKSLLHYAENEGIKTWNYRHELNFHVTLSPHWKLKFANTPFHDNRNHIFTYFADASIRFTHRLFDIEMNGRNLFNHTHINYINIGSLTEKYANYTLRPREFLLKLRFSF